MRGPKAGEESGDLVFVVLHAILAPFGWGGPMVRPSYANPIMWLAGSSFFTLVWLAPFVFIVAVIVWLVGARRDAWKDEGVARKWNESSA